MWTGPRGTISFTHALLGTIATIPNSNRATYAQIVVLSRPHISAENIHILGQSGFIRLVPPAGSALDLHFRDQLELDRQFGFKPMRLFPNAQRTPQTGSDGADAATARATSSRSSASPPQREASPGVSTSSDTIEMQCADVWTLAPRP